MPNRCLQWGGQEVSVTCPGQASTQSEREFGVRDPQIVPLGSDAEIWLSLPRGPGSGPAVPGDANTEHATSGPSCWHFTGLRQHRGQEQQYRDTREIIESAE